MTRAKQLMFLHNGRKIRVRSISIWIILLFLNIGLVTFIYLSDRAIKKERTAISTQTEMTLIGQSLANGSDLLTNDVREFVITGDLIFLQDYWLEVNIRKSRDKAVQRLAELNTPLNEIQYLRIAKKNSDKLINAEVRAMKLLLLAMGVPEENMYPEIKRYKLSADDLALPINDKINTAQAIMFDKDYIDAKASIMNPIKEFRETMLERVSKESEDARKRTNRVFLTAEVSTVVAIILLVLVIWIRIF